MQEGDVGKLRKLHKRVVNKDLLMDDEKLGKYLKYDEETDLNYPLRTEPKLRERQDYIFITKAMWLSITDSFRRVYLRRKITKTGNTVSIKVYFKTVI